MKDTSRQPLLRTLITLAVPAALSFLTQNLYHVNDAWFIGKLGSAATAGMMPVVMVQVANFGVILVLARGTQSLVGRAFGAGKLDAVASGLGQGLRLALLVLVPLALVEWLFAAEILSIMGATGEALDQGVRYMRTLLFLLPCLFAMPILDFSIQGLGDTRTPFRLQCVAVLANTVLNFALVLPQSLVWGGEGLSWAVQTATGPLFEVAIPLALPFDGGLSSAGLGVMGAALATGLSRGLAAGLALRVLVRKMGLASLLTRAAYRYSRERAAEILRVGLPAGSSTFLFAIVGMFVTGLVGEHGEAALGGYYIGFRALESVSFMVVLGFGVAAGTAAAHAAGAGDFARARRAGHLGALLCAIPMAATTAMFVLMPEVLVGAFTDDPATAAVGVAYLATMAWCQVPQGIEMVYGDAMAGAGSSLKAALVSIPGNVLRVPLVAAAAGFGWGLQGIWYAIASTSILKGIGMTALFASRKWEKAMLAGHARIDGLDEGNDAVEGEA